MFPFAGFCTRNPAYVTRHWRNAGLTRNAILAYRNNHPDCAWCGRQRNLQVHHKVPVSVAPEKAGAESNMMSLCRVCHLVVAHNGSFDRFVPNISDVCKEAKVHKTLKSTYA